MTYKNKSLHNLTIEGISIQTQFQYNINTNHITIGNTFNGHNYRRKPKPTNKQCATYLGVIIAEEILNQVFKNIKRMPYGNPGFDFVCNNGFLVDSKASCIRINGKYNNWSFTINKNKIPDYFALLAFDNRTDLTPLYFWLIPGNVVNDKQLISICESNISKWNEYRQDIDKIISCCNMLKGN